MEITLIYANVNANTLEDVGMLHDYTLDLAYGSSENDFELKIKKNQADIKPGMAIYIDGTEYGGIIDEFKIDSDENSIIYSGRTWHGILEGKYLYPNRNKDAIVYSGNVTNSIDDMLERIGLKNSIISCFYDENAEVVQEPYKISCEDGNYQRAYTALRDYTYSGILKPKIINGVISVYPADEYTNDDVSNAPYKITQTFTNTNHFHLVSSSDDKTARYEIDIYIDVDGNIIPYSKENPVSDSDYFMSVPEAYQEKVQKGISEIVEYRESGVTDTYNYVMLTSKPKDWDTKYNDYYVHNESADEDDNAEEFINVESDSYRKLTSKPADWDVLIDNSNYGCTQYYTKFVDGLGRVQYDSVSNDTYEVYTMMTTKPSDWDTNFGAYYSRSGNNYNAVSNGADYKRILSKPSWFYSTIRESTGGTHKGYEEIFIKKGNGSYEQLKGKTETVKKIMKTKPSDWNKNNYHKYFYRGINSKGKTDYIPCNVKYVKKVSKKSSKKKGKTKVTYKKETRKFSAFKANKYYMNVSVKIEAKWEKNVAYYRDVNYKKTPAFAKNRYYMKESRNRAAAWQSGKYYIYTFPDWVGGRFYQRITDHYAAMISDAMTDILKSTSKQQLEIELSEKNQYDINDIIEITDEETGITARERITKKIIKIEKGNVTISYEEGE